jgi:hypothetical protein
VTEIEVEVEVAQAIESGSEAGFALESAPGPGRG